MINPDTNEKLLAAAKDVGYGRIPPYQHCECFTTGAFDLFLSDYSDKGRVFSLLQAICSKYESVKDDARLLDGYILLLAQLARGADTTEMPEGMERIIVENSTKTNELQEWYRLNC